MVQNNNYPKDALSQQVEKGRLDQLLMVFIPQTQHVVTGKFILRTITLDGWQPKKYLQEFDLYELLESISGKLNNRKQDFWNN